MSRRFFAARTTRKRASFSRSVRYWIGFDVFFSFRVFFDVGPEFSTAPAGAGARRDSISTSCSRDRPSKGPAGGGPSRVSGVVWGVSMVEVPNDTEYVNCVVRIRSATRNQTQI